MENVPVVLPVFYIHSVGKGVVVVGGVLAGDAWIEGIWWGNSSVGQIGKHLRPPLLELCKM